MPYTPPSQLSPVASKQSSPAMSRSHSYIKGQFLSPEAPGANARPQLPRSSASSSYLNKHRRSPSLNDVKNEVLHNGESYADNGGFDPHGSIRQSPPPVSNSLIPAGMTISPPDSSHNSSDEEGDHQSRGRSRGLELTNLKELKDAIRSIEQRKSGSPTRRVEAPKIAFAPAPIQTDGPAQHTSVVTRPPLSQEARKISHSRSSTESDIVFEPTQKQLSPVHFRRDSEDSDSEGALSADRPPMVRKKSGELVRPALRPSSRRRPSSMPGTPTYSKAVHFDSHLEHVRHFLQVDRPLAVSAGSSPVENYESESEFPFGSDESSTRPRTPSFEWELRLANFPADVESRRTLPVFVERVFLSTDNKNLVGTVAVQNLAFHKVVVARFTLDYWKTTSEVTADFNADVRRKSVDGLDRFNFSIRLADQAHLENKTLFFCIKYTVNGLDYWDNNGSFNYQVDFVKKPKVQQNKNAAPGLGARPVSALPRSRPSPPTSSGGRPKSMPVSFDDFSTGFDSFGSFGQSAGSLIGEPKLKLRSPRSKTELVSDAPSRRPKSNGQAFGNRYDFNSSLTAAKNSAWTVLGDQSGLTSRTDTKQSREVPATMPLKSGSITPTKQASGVNSTTAPAVAPLTSKPAALLSEKPPLTSQSYQELVDKYCFFGTPRSSEPLTRSALSMVDGANDSATASDLSAGSARSSNSSGSSTPTPPRSLSPVPSSRSTPGKQYVPYIARSASPLPSSGSYFGSRSQSPASFGYPYHSAQSNPLRSDSLTPTAIHG